MGLPKFGPAQFAVRRELVSSVAAARAVLGRVGCLSGMVETGGVAIRNVQGLG